MCERSRRSVALQFLFFANSLYNDSIRAKRRAGQAVQAEVQSRAVFAVAIVRKFSLSRSVNGRTPVVYFPRLATEWLASRNCLGPGNGGKHPQPISRPGPLMATRITACPMQSVVDNFLFSGGGKRIDAERS